MVVAEEGVRGIARGPAGFSLDRWGEEGDGADPKGRDGGMIVEEIEPEKARLARRAKGRW